MTPRATPMAPDERRRAIVTAALPLLAEHGRETTTRQIAHAAGIAEGTVFRAFPTKEELFAAALEQAFDPGPFLDELAAVDPALPLRERLVALTTVLQRRFQGIFRLMIAMAVPKPPVRSVPDQDATWRQEVGRRMAALLAPDADRLRLPPEDVVRMLRLLTFSGSHPHISEQRPLTPDQIVDLVLHGVARSGESHPCC